MKTPRTELASWFIIGLAFFTALFLASAAPSRVTGPASRAQCQQLYAEAAEREPGERQDAARRFRGSLWSQDDDFHFKEAKRVKDFAKSRHASITSLLDALDEGMHQDWPVPSNNLPNPKVMPCRPRLIY
jgi:hypothetical protein